MALLLVQGLRQEDIAKRLSLSAKTVNTHKTRLFEKLGIQRQHRVGAAGRRSTACWILRRRSSDRDRR